MTGRFQGEFWEMWATVPWVQKHRAKENHFLEEKSGQIMTTSAETTLNGGVVRESHFAQGPSPVAGSANGVLS